MIFLLYIRWKYTESQRQVNQPHHRQVIMYKKGERGDGQEQYASERRRSSLFSPQSTPREIRIATTQYGNGSGLCLVFARLPLFLSQCSVFVMAQSSSYSRHWLRSEEVALYDCVACWANRRFLDAELCGARSHFLFFLQMFLQFSCFLMCSVCVLCVFCVYSVCSVCSVCSVSCVFCVLCVLCVLCVTCVFCSLLCVCVCVCVCVVCCVCPGQRKFYQRPSGPISEAKQPNEPW